MKMADRSLTAARRKADGDASLARDSAASLQQDFRNAMAALAASACLVTAAEGKVRIGRTVTAAFSLSVDPPSILVSIASGCELAEMIHARGGFSFAMLAHEQKSLADAFAGKLSPEHRFEVGEWREWASGHPRLMNAVAAMDCAVTGEMEANDHILFVGTAREIDLDDTRDPLVWHRRQYNALQPKR